MFLSDPDAADKYYSIGVCGKEEDAELQLVVVVVSAGFSPPAFSAF